MELWWDLRIGNIWEIGLFAISLRVMYISIHLLIRSSIYLSILYFEYKFQFITNYPFER